MTGLDSQNVLGHESHVTEAIPRVTSPFPTALPCTGPPPPRRLYPQTCGNLSGKRPDTPQVSRDTSRETHLKGTSRHTSSAVPNYNGDF